MTFLIYVIYLVNNLKLAILKYKHFKLLP